MTTPPEPAPTAAPTASPAVPPAPPSGPPAAAAECPYPSGTPGILDPDLVADPYGGFGRLRERAPVVLGRGADGLPTWYVTRYDDVRAVLGDPRFVVDPRLTPGSAAVEGRERMLAALELPEEFLPYVSESVLDVDGERHARLRSLVSRAFTVRRVTALRPRVAALVAELLDGLGETAELIGEFAYPLPITVICELVGIPREDRELWRTAGSALASIEPGSKGGAARALAEYTHALVERRRAEPAGDLLSDLIRVGDEDGDRLSDVELVTMVLGLATAGHETTAHLIGNAVLALLSEPGQLAVLLADPDRWPEAVHELVRHCGSILISQLRYATEDVEVGGRLIRAGEPVQPVVAAANRDPRAFADPDRLDLARRLPGPGDGHIGFGLGAHYCLGAALARQECELALRGLFDRHPGIALLDPEPRWLPTPGLRQLAALPVRLR